MEQQRSTAQEIVTELTRRGYKMAEETNDHSVYFDVSREVGNFRSYAIEPNQNNGWELNQKAVGFDENGEDDDSDTDIGVYLTAIEIADAVDEAEEDF